MRVAVIAEGDGDKPAVRVILGRLPGLYADLTQVQVGAVYNAHGRSNLTKDNGIERVLPFLRPGTRRRLGRSGLGSGLPSDIGC